mgnify:CR=1 FL=1
MDYPPPNLDRIRQRRATLVAKTIINQMAIQPQSSSIEELLPKPRRRSANSSLTSLSSPEPIRRYEAVQDEFSELSKQIAALLTPSDDEA